MKRGHRNKSKVGGELVENMQISSKKEGELNFRKKTRRERKVRRKPCCISAMSSCRKLAGPHIGEREKEREGGRKREGEGGRRQRRV